MDDIHLKVTLVHDAIIEFVEESHDDLARMRIVANHGDHLLVIRSYREYLDVMNLSKPDWSLQQHHDVYKWMHKVGWLKPQS